MASTTVTVDVCPTSWAITRYVLSNTLPNIISVPLNMNESRTVLDARIRDIVRRLDGAVLGSPLGLEIDVSTSGRVQDTLRRFEPRLRHFWTRRGVF